MQMSSGLDSYQSFQHLGYRSRKLVVQFNETPNVPPKPNQSFNYRPQTRYTYSRLFVCRDVVAVVAVVWCGVVSKTAARFPARAGNSCRGRSTNAMDVIRKNRDVEESCKPDGSIEPRLFRGAQHKLSGE